MLIVYKLGLEYVIDGSPYISPCLSDTAIRLDKLVRNLVLNFDLYP